MTTNFEQQLIDDIGVYRNIISSTLWMSRRYADGRDTYTPEMVEEAIAKCAELKLFIEDDHTLKDARWVIRK